jgi:hypothetical protein
LSKEAEKLANSRAKAQARKAKILTSLLALSFGLWDYSPISEK